MCNNNYFLSATRALFTIFLFGLSAQSFAQAVANDDLFDFVDVQPITDPAGECGVGYVFDPLTNDVVITPDYNAMSQGISYVSGPQFGQMVINFQSSVPQFIYFPGCPSDGTFSVPAVYTYTLVEANDPNNPATAQITINPPPQPSTTPDFYSASNASEIQEVPSSVTGLFDYVLQQSPLANDNVFVPADMQQTLLAQGNFTPAAGTVGTLQNTRGQTTVFTYSPGVPFTQTAVFNYFLVDGNGNRIQGTDATITISPPVVVDAVDDTVSADQLTTTVDQSGNIGYRLDPFANDIFVGNDPNNLDLVQTLAASNFVRAGGVGTISANNNNGIEVIYYPGQAFTQAAVFNYTLYDLSGNTDSASITINPPGTQAPRPPIDRSSDINDACAVELADQRVPAICSSAITDGERLLMLSTITAQSDALFGMQGDLIGNIRQRMSENRSVYNPASVAGLNSTLYGKSVPIGQIAQELLKPLTGGGAADDLGSSGRLGFFLNGNFSAGDRDETGLTGGYDQEGYNFTSGIDYRLSLNLIMGAALGIANEKTDFASNRGEQSADATSFSFYGNYFPSNSLYADWLFMLTQGDLNIDRNVLGEVAQADTDGNLWSFAGTLGYHWNKGAWEMDSYGRVEYSSLEIDAYTESGSSFDLTVFDQEAESLEAALGFKVARVVSLAGGVLVPSLDLEWLSQFEDDARFIGVNMEQISTGFAVKDEGADSSYFNAAFSLSSIFANGFSAYFRMESQLGDDHLGRTTYGGGLRWEF